MVILSSDPPLLGSEMQAAGQRESLRGRCSGLHVYKSWLRLSSQIFTLTWILVSSHAAMLGQHLLPVGSMDPLAPQS